MIAIDTSVAVAAFASWHEGHRGAQRALERKPKLPAHVAIETYSVLTRLPPPHRVDGRLVIEFLDQRFPDPPLTLAPERYGQVLSTVARAGLIGGSVYDALIAATAVDLGFKLLTRDRRALSTYEALGAEVEIVE